MMSNDDLMKSLREIRAERGESLSAFAARIGATAGQVHEWEAGNPHLTVERAARIERMLKVKGLVDSVVAARVQADRDKAA